MNKISTEIYKHMYIKVYIAKTKKGVVEDQ